MEILIVSLLIINLGVAIHNAIAISKIKVEVKEIEENKEYNLNKEEGKAFIIKQPTGFGKNLLKQIPRIGQIP